MARTRLRSKTEANPFIRFRDRLDSYESVRRQAMTDDEFVDLVGELDERVATVDGKGFVETPVLAADDLARHLGASFSLHVKDETGNVGGSHKARHLFGTALHLLIDRREDTRRLAIASCGNAALGAAIIARAMDRDLDVFVPVWADLTIVAALVELGADVQRCERRADEQGDPAYLRFREALGSGSVAFGVQGVDTPTTFDGGRTLGWELDEQVKGIEALYVQVGGGALATSVSRGVGGARLFPVQAEGCAPLRRAWDLLDPGFDFPVAAANQTRFMWPWEPTPASAAEGILDDVTYDWLVLLEQTRVTDGEPIVVPESVIVEAPDIAFTHTGIEVSATGAAGLAGLIHQPPQRAKSAAVIFTGTEPKPPDST